jgi:hypothetical protein
MKRTLSYAASALVLADRAASAYQVAAQRPTLPIVIGSILLLLMAAVAVTLIVWLTGDFPQASVRSPKRVR